MNKILLLLLSVLVLTGVGCESKIEPTVKQEEKPAIDISTTPSSTTIVDNKAVVSVVTPTPAIKGWKVYVDNEYRFIFSYPPNLVLNGSPSMNDFYLDDKQGRHVIYLDAGKNSFTSNLDEDTKSWNGYNEDKQKAVNVLLEKISDTTTTIGYLSRWKVYDIESYNAASDTRVFKTQASGFESKAKFGSKIADLTPSKGGQNTIAYFETKILPNWSPINLDLFRQIVSTFQFTD